MISTGDKDMAQLVGPNIELLNTMSNTRLDRIGVKARFDVFPEQIVDYLALVGDSSDNIPGVTGVGQKTAAKWLNQYQTPGRPDRACRRDRRQSRREPAQRTCRCWNCRASSPPSIPLWLSRSARTAAARARRMSRGCANCTRAWNCARCSSPWAPEAGPRLPSRRDRQRRRRVAAVAAPGRRRSGGGRRHHAHQPRNYDKVISQEEFESWLQRLEDAPLISFDTETDSLDYMQARIVGVSFAVPPGEAAYVPLGHDYPGAPPQLDRDRVLAALKPLLEDSTKAKLGHHLKFDAHVLANYGIALNGQRFDSMLESYVLNSVATRHDMDSTRREISRHQNHSLRGCRRQGREAAHLQSGGRRACGGILRGGCRRHVATASGDLAADRGAAAPEVRLRKHRTAAGAGAVPHGAQRRVGGSRSC